MSRKRLDPSRYTARLARLGDARDIVAVQRAAVEKAWRGIIDDFEAFLAEKFDPDSQFEKYKERINDTARILVVVEAEGEIVGFGGARPHGAEEQPAGFEYQGNAFYLLPTHEGIGASLVLAEGILKALQARGVKIVCGWCLAGNRGARNFYERRGGALVEGAIAPPEYDAAPHVAYGWHF